MIEPNTGKAVLAIGASEVSSPPTPRELAHTENAIEQSRRILELPDNWDDEGSPGYASETWERAVRFVRTNARRLWDDRELRVEAPAINHGPDGSIDIHWRKGGRILLINIPPQADTPAEYYGRNDRGHEVKGTLDTSEPNHWLMMWLLE
jgi:hypothetical protein